MADLNVNSIGDASGGTTTTINGFTPTVSNMAGRNRIINGDMRIDQRNAGASVAMSTGNFLPVDRFKSFAHTGSGHTAQQSTDVPAGVGFDYSTKLTVGTGGAPISTDLNIFYQPIEGFNVADMMFGSANAKTVTVSFWVKSSLTGNFGVGIQNSDVSRGYPGQYNIASANTWEFKTVTIAGDITGTWLKNNGMGMYLSFDLGSGSSYEGTLNTWGGGNLKRTSSQVKLIETSGATFYITGVQLEEGSVATPFEHRQYGQELALCQRYYEKSFNTDVVPGSSAPGAQLAYCPGNTNRVYGTIICRVTKRAGATYIIYSTSGATGQMRDGSAGVDIAASLTTAAGENGVGIASTAGISAVTNQIQFHYTASAEL
jgi:hypothetical protein